MYIRSTDGKRETLIPGHIMHAENVSLEKSTILGVVLGRRGRGKPCMHWMYGVKDATKLSLPELWDAVSHFIFILYSWTSQLGV